MFTHLIKKCIVVAGMGLTALYFNAQAVTQQPSFANCGRDGCSDTYRTDATRTATRMMNQGLAKEAFQVLEPELKVENPHPKTLYLAAQALYKSGRIDEAQKYLVTAHEKDPMHTYSGMAYSKVCATIVDNNPKLKNIQNLCTDRETLANNTPRPIKPDDQRTLKDVVMWTGVVLTEANSEQINSFFSKELSVAKSDYPVFYWSITLTLAWLFACALMGSLARILTPTNTKAVSTVSTKKK